eukprot:scaffold634_cov185-Ochromonas_danica.AAC.2
MYDKGEYPKLSGLAPALTYAILLSIARFFLQNYLIKESVVRAYSKISGRDFDSVCHYLKDRRHRNAYDKKMVKFVEAFWRFVFYSAFVYLGYRALFVPETLPYVYETSSMWTNWPKFNIPANIRFYYLIELGCYIHQLCWTEVNRSDATEMIAHHIITITLILLSYLLCYWEIGSIFLLIHDVSDVLLEGAKGLHIFWFYLICRMIYKLIYLSVEGDERSEDEDEFVQYEGMDNTQHGQAKKDN